jgi:hypothetical protein
LDIPDLKKKKKKREKKEKLFFTSTARANCGVVRPFLALRKAANRAKSLWVNSSTRPSKLTSI